MHMHPAIEELRGNWAPQHRAQRALLKRIGSWQKDQRTIAVQAELERYADGHELSECDALSELMSDHYCARAWVDDLWRGLVASLREEPLGTVPFSYRQSESYSTLQIMTHGRASLHVSAYCKRALSACPKTALVPDRESTELILNGVAHGLHHMFDERGCATSSHIWSVGDRIEMDSKQARHFSEIKSPLVVLQLTRSAEEPGPTNEYRLSDGSLLKSASGDKQASRNILALAVLGALGDQSSLAAMGQLARDETRDTDLRWEAVRQSLALNPEEGLSLLATLARNSDDPLQGPARKLRDQLFDTFPQLVQLPLETA